jgi:hypothetical protein
MPAQEDFARIRRAELAGLITAVEAQVLEAALHDGRPTSMVHALGRLPLNELQGRWLATHPAYNGQMPGGMPASRDQLISQLLDRVT